MSVLSVNLRKWDEYTDDRTIAKAGKVPHKGKKVKSEYVDLLCAFDIETTSVDSIEESIMYIWQLAIEDVVYYGRTWEEFREFVGLLRSDLDGRTLVLYVHQLAFEFQYLKTALGKDNLESVFAINTRKIAKVTFFTDNAIEFRCSYILSNLSLLDWTIDLGVAHKKIVGYKYDEERFPWTELTEDELAYVANDVIGLVECLHTTLDRDGDTLHTVPMTSTGYVRRDVKKSMKMSGTRVEALLPSPHLYKLLRQGFRGGNTHANRFFVGSEITNVTSMDRVSSYPDVMLNGKYPCTPFKESTDFRISEIGGRKAYLMKVRFTNIRLKDEYAAIPYISYSKVAESWTKDQRMGRIDNGRILSAESITLVITDIDFVIIDKQYAIDRIEIIEIYSSVYDNLPASITDVVLEYFNRKTQLKDVEGQEIYYQKAKGSLNANFGMMAQDPGKVTVMYDRATLTIKPDVVNIDVRLKDFYKRSFVLPYQWGVWVTAQARLELEKGIDAVGYDCVYVDTDSVKYINNHDADFERYNKRKADVSRKNGGCARNLKSGKESILGLYKVDGFYTSFKTWGAKKYAYIKKGELSATIAGVAKKSRNNPFKPYGAQELMKAGGLKAFSPGFVFRETAGIEAVYNDHDTYTREINGHEVEIPSNVYMANSTYTIKLSPEYDYLLSILTNIDY